jgi:hypothetical protein
MIHVDVEGVGKKEIYWSYGKARGNVANQSKGRESTATETIGVSFEKGCLNIEEWELCRWIEAA